MENIKKKTLVILIGGIVSAIMCIICLIAKLEINAEKRNIKNGIASVVQVGSKTMSKKEYLEYASSVGGKLTAAIIILLIITIILFVIFYRENKNGNFKIKPQKAYAQPYQAYGQPQQTYGQSQQTYAHPQKAYVQPQQAYGQSQQTYVQPQQAYVQPQQAYGQPQQAYGQSQQTYGQQVHKLDEKNGTKNESEV